jgi:hypothetical protein
MYKTKSVCTIPERKELHIEWLHHALHALPCKKEMAVSSVGMVRDSEGWRTRENSWMELEAAEE